MRLFGNIGRVVIVAASVSIGLSVAANAACRNTGNFNKWLADFKSEARANGISDRTIKNALGNVSYSKKVIGNDRKQVVFSLSFLDFSSRLISQNRLNVGRSKLKKNANMFQQIENTYGAPGPVLTAFWGLETDFGGNIGNFPTLTALATLAYDCRRPELFRPQLMDALRLIDRGDLSANQMIGAWAGELGQTQFLPSDYFQRGIDFDGDGTVNLLRSAPDALASSANLLRHHGWKAGQPWLEEVVVPAELPWEQADIAIKLPRSQWAQWGVTYRDGQALPGDQMPVSLHLPMGRHGPAFLAYENFDVYTEWNQSLVYATTAAYFATRLAGAPKVSAGRKKVQSLSGNQVKQLQRKLEAKGYDVGGVDGTIGAKTRAAVKDMQIKLGMPADSFPTPDLLRRL
ncbi:MAG: lytic murein transglycosylase [Stappiaceae bacterium]